MQNPGLVGAFVAFGADEIELETLREHFHVGLEQGVAVVEVVEFVGARADVVDHFQSGFEDREEAFGDELGDGLAVFGAVHCV